MSRTRVLHPFLFAVYPVVAMYASSAGQVFWADVWPALFVCLLLGGMLFLGWFGLVGEWHRAGYFTTISLFFAFAYAYAQLFFAVLAGGLNLAYFDLAWLLAYIGTMLLPGRVRREQAKLTRLLNIVAMVLLAMPLFSLVHFEWHNPVAFTVNASTGENSLLDAPVVPGPGRSIFYLIFDRYADARTLATDYSYDNSGFLGELRGRGFYVAERSVANYPKTGHSLASSLNMTYLTDLQQQYGGDSRDWRPLFLKLQDFALWRVLRKNGYRYIHLGSWWGGTHSNALADENFSESEWFDSLNEFEQTLLMTTVFERLIPARFNRYANESQCRRVTAKFERMLQAADSGQPVFVFSHMLLPHDPYVFDAQGRCMSNRESRQRSERDNYVGQVEFANQQILLLVDRLMAMVPRPIIIVQSDEGPFPARYVEDMQNFDWYKATPQELRQKMRILNTYYLPDIDVENYLYPSISPVNTFRVVLNEYMGFNLPILPDRNYVFRDGNHLYDFRDVTEQVR